MAQTYPDTQGFAYSFARAELTMNGRVWTAVSSVSIDQPTEEGEVKGTKPYPLARTEGTMGLGEGTVTFSDERERLDFLSALGDGYRQKLWSLSWVLSGTAGSERKIECFGCRVLSNPIEHEEGADALGGDIGFSFLSHKIEGNSPHAE